MFIQIRKHMKIYTKDKKIKEEFFQENSKEKHGWKMCILYISICANRKKFLFNSIFAIVLLYTSIYTCRDIYLLVLLVFRYI